MGGAKPFNVKVAVRVRPLLGHDRSQKAVVHATKGAKPSVTVPLRRGDERAATRLNPRRAPGPRGGVASFRKRAPSTRPRFLIFSPSLRAGRRPGQGLPGQEAGDRLFKS